MKLAPAPFPALALTVAAALGLPDAALADTLDGVWRIKDSPVEVRFEPCGGASCGVLVTSARIKADPDARDVKNKDAALRTRKLKGLAMFTGLKAQGAAWNGQVYLPGNGGTYGVTIRRLDANTLTAKGCLAPMVCQTNTLVRIGG